MVDAAQTDRIRPHLDAGKPANATGMLWFLAAVLGQWAFVYYIVSLYGLAGVQ